MSRFRARVLLVRNRRTFEDLESLESQFIGSFANSLFDWSRAWSFTTSNSIAEFLESLYPVHTDHSLKFLGFFVCMLYAHGVVSSE